jgi:hypothetical protein
VVSEETGAISHVYKGQMVRGVTIEELRAFLISVLVPPAKTRSLIEWLRSHTTEHYRHASGTTVITRNEVRRTTNGSGK